ncbi:pseudoazurin [Roseovarius nanhaiticus]|uniref:Pseudoazurin n=1 Tax=Roseovarius nanhaiticus TaxID=573024 RepID=A0A1N7HNP1_9RHOB|nr:pseudoazurin [Roseovarius nanhaiticus]SEL39036.1 pseudoazurin [Roseovarius nanhaiticus]SIS26485.1 pseudoazurin [Roseovarius nanhaiticus]
MKLNMIAAAALMALAPYSALAETIEVKMLNKGEAGVMVFEPRFVSAEVGDTVVFLPVDKGHNAETIKGMVPEGQDSFTGKMNKEVSVEVTSEGMIGVVCKPHAAMGMVMVIQVGGADAPEGFLDAKMPRKAKEAFEEILAEGAAS